MDDFPQTQVLFPSMVDLVKDSDRQAFANAEPH